MMNTLANGNGMGTAARSSQAVRNFHQDKFLLEQALQGIQKVAKITSPIAARLASIAAKTLNSITSRMEEATVPLPRTLLRAGEIAAVQMEAEFFGTHEAEADVSPTTAAREMALTEVLAAEANHSQNEAEAAALISTALPIAIASMGGRGVLRPIVPALVQATARLVRLLRSRGAAGRQLLRLIPTILRRTIASLLAAQQAGRAIDSALARRVMAAHAARVLANSQTMTRAMIRNAIIRQRTVAPAKPTIDSKVDSSNLRRFSQMAMQNEGLFEAPVSHVASPYSHPYSNPEFEDEWESSSNPELESVWEMHETSHYSHPYSNPEFEDEWETPEFHYSHLYSHPEFEDQWEMPESQYSNPYPNPEFESDQFLPFLIPFAIKAGAKLAGKLALKGAKKLAMKGAKRLISRAPRVLNNLNKIQQLRVRRQPQSAVASQMQIARNLAAQLRNVLGEGESQAAALEAEFFGANEFEGELANHEAAHEIALTEVLAAEASHTKSESEAKALLNAAFPITIRVMDRSKMLSQITPSLLKANANLVRDLRSQGRDGRQFLRIVSAIHRRTIPSLQLIQRNGRTITPELVSQVMRAHTARFLRTPRVLGPALVRNFAIQRATVAPVK